MSETMNPPNQLDILLDAAEAQARIVLVTLKFPSLLPMWVIVTGTGETVLRQTPFANDAQKLAVEFYMKEELRELEAVAYSFLAEAWMAHVELDQITSDDRLTSDWLRPTYRPDRIEIVTAIAVNRAQTKTRTWEIIRDGTATGKVKRLKRREALEAETFGGWTTKLLE